jgi:hypothetical protein
MTSARQADIDACLDARLLAQGQPPRPSLCLETPARDALNPQILSSTQGQT